MQIDDPPTSPWYWVEKSKSQVFKDWIFWDVLNQEFLGITDADDIYLTKLNASNTYLTKSSASTTYLSKATADSDYLTASEIYDITNTKQNNIPNFTLKTSQTMYGVAVKVYTDGLTVYVSIDGQFDGSSSVPSGGSVGSIGTLSNTSYAPPNQMQNPVHTNTATKIILETGGSVRMYNPNSSKSITISTGFYYPLKSRIP